MSKKMLKLYVWDNVLCDYTGGVAFALASSPEEAKELLMKSGLHEHQWQDLKLDGQDYEAFDEPVASYVYGGG